MKNTSSLTQAHYIKSFVKRAFADFKKFWKPLVLGVLVVYGFSFLGEYLGDMAAVIVQIVTTFMGIGYMLMTLDIIDGKSVKFLDIFRRPTLKQLIFVIFASIILTIVIIVGLIALIIPGLIVGIALSMAIYLIIDNNAGVFSSLKQSWQLTKGNRWKIFIVLLIAGLIAILGLFAFGVGILITAPIAALMQARLYRDLQALKANEDEATVDVVKAVVEPISETEKTPS